MPNDRLPQLPDTVVATFESLMAQARAAGESDANAMNLATAQPDGRVSSRVVLMKAIDTRGLVFYTNLESDKGRQLQANPRAALCFHWKALRDGVQVRFEGGVVAVTDAEADAYFATRPRASQIGAWASFQSQTLPDRDTFEQRCAAFDEQFAGREVTRPRHWSGLRLVPDLVEFWYGVQFRLHERHRHEWRDGAWSERLLYP